MQNGDNWREDAVSLKSIDGTAAEKCEYVAQRREAGGVSYHMSRTVLSDCVTRNAYMTAYWFACAARPAAKETPHRARQQRVL